MADPRQPITPLRFDTPIVDPTKGTPTAQFIRLWQQLFGNETGTNEEAATALAAANAAQTTADAAQLTADNAQADVDAAELEIDALQLAAVPTGGALGEVLTKDSASDYDMSWQPAAGGGGGGAWTLVSTTVIAAPVAQVDVIGLAGATDIRVIMFNVASAGGFRRIRLSTNNGASFFSGATDYQGVGAGASATDSSLGLNNTAGGGAISGVMDIGNANILNCPKYMTPHFGNNVQGLFVGDNANDVDAIRVFDTAGNLTGGTIYVLKR